MKLKEDWSLAYFLHYVCWIGYWGIGLYLVTMIAATIMVSSDGYTRIIDVPVLMEMEQFSDYEDLDAGAASIAIPDHISIDVDVKAKTSEHGFEMVLLFLVQSLSSIAAIAVLFILSLIFKHVAKEEPFHESNPRNLFYCGWITFATGCVNLILVLIPVPFLHKLDLPAGYHIEHLSLPSDTLLITGIIFIVLGYVFKEGARLYEEQKLTV